MCAMFKTFLGGNLDFSHNLKVEKDRSLAWTSAYKICWADVFYAKYTLKWLVLVALVKEEI